MFATTSHASTEESVNEIIGDSQLSEALASKTGQWVLAPMPVSNPTVGSGLQAVLLYLHPKNNESSYNTTTGLVGLYTDTSSWFTGLFHDNSLLQDKIRFTGFIGQGKFNLRFYGIGDAPAIGDQSYPYQFEVFVTSLKVLGRIPSTGHWFGGLQYLYIDSTTTIETSNLLPGLPNISSTLKTAGLGPLITFDTRDNNYYPTRGQWIEAKWLNYDEGWGGDNAYSKTTLFANYYQPAVDSLTVAYRMRLQSSAGDVPYFDLPTLQMGGFSRGRYRDDTTLSLHAEGRYKFKPRWGVIGFYETGWYNNSVSEIFDGRRIKSFGAGVRWQVTKEQPMHLGIDAAFSTDDQAIYVQVGERF